MEPQEIESISQHLVAIAAHQDILSNKLDLLNQRMVTATRRIDITLASIRELLERG